MGIKHLKLALLAAVMLTAGCVLKPLHNLDHIPVQRFDGKMLTLDQVQQAIIEGARQKQWKCEVTSPGHIIAKHSQMASDGLLSATVAIDFSATEYSIDYKDSQGLSYNPARNTIHMHYQLWESNLQESIDQAVNDLAF